MNKEIRKYMAQIGRKGGSKSRRSLSPEAAQAMVRIREAKRAYRAYYAQCFWSYDPDLKLSQNDVSWVAERLMRYGGRKAWEKGNRLCR